VGGTQRANVPHRAAQQDPVLADIFRRGTLRQPRLLGAHEVDDHSGRVGTQRAGDDAADPVTAFEEPARLESVVLSTDRANAAVVQ
jgi:hypothetical protein